MQLQPLRKFPKNETITCIVAGTNCSKVAEEVAGIDSVNKVLVADDATLKGFLPEILAPLVVNSQKQFNFSPYCCWFISFWQKSVASNSCFARYSTNIGYNWNHTMSKHLFAQYMLEMPFKH